MVGRAEHMLDVETFQERCNREVLKRSSVVRLDNPWAAMPTDNLFKYKLCHSGCSNIVSCAGFRPFCEVVDGHYCVALVSVCSWKVHDINAPSVEGRSDWYRAHYLSANGWIAALTHFASFNVVSNVTVHVRPPELLFDARQCRANFEVSTGWSVVACLQYDFHFRPSNNAFGLF